MLDVLYEITGSIPEVSTGAFIALCLVSFSTSVISATFGLGGGVTLLTIIAFLLPPLAIIPIHGVIQMSSDLSRALMMWRNIKFTWIIPFLLGSMVGAAVGGQIVFAMPKHLLQGLIGLFVLYSVWSPAMKAFHSSWLSFASLGGISSFATMFVGGTGVIVAPFVRASTDGRRMTVATQAAFMSWQHGIKILMFSVLGFAFSTYASLIGAMIVFGIFGTLSGKAILLKMPEKVFQVALKTVLTLLALGLLYQAVTNGMF